MRSSSIWSVIAAKMVLTAVSQPSGRFLYTGKEGRYRLTFDVYEDKSVAIIFDTTTKHFIDGRYPLSEQASGNYAIDFSDTPGGVELWYKGIKRVDPDISFHDGDLTNLTFSPYGSVSVGFEGKKIELYGYGFLLVEGTFMYTEGAPPHPFLRINYTVQAKARLSLQFICFDNQTSTVSLDLTLSFYNAYDLGPPNKLAELKEDIARL